MRKFICSSPADKPVSWGLCKFVKVQATVVKDQKPFNIQKEKAPDL